MVHNILEHSIWQYAILLYYYYSNRKWNKELDEAIEALQLNMEMECDNYFNVIKPIAIKVIEFMFHIIES